MTCYLNISIARSLSCINDHCKMDFDCVVNQLHAWKQHHNYHVTLKIVLHDFYCTLAQLKHVPHICFNYYD